MSKKSSSTSTTNSTVTSTPTNPQWVTSSTQGLQNRINSLLDVKDPSAMVPGASALQTEAFDQAGDLGGWQSGLHGAASTVQGMLDAKPMAAQSASSRSLLDVDLDGYMNPYLDQVVGSTLAGFDEQSAARAAQLAAAQGRGQKFSGSGSAIERAMFNRGAVQDRAATEAGLRSAGFDRATGLATGDLNREAETSRFNAGQSNQMSLAERDADMRAAGLLGDFALQGGNQSRADLGLLATLGGEQREIEREKLGAETDLLQLISALNANQPYGLFRGETRNETGTTTGKSRESDPIGTAGKIASTIGTVLAFSDKRLKTDIETVGKDAAGRRVVAFRYKGEPKHVSRIGHIAQDVEKSDPHAVRKIGKYKAIDYGLLGDVA